jgi:hypothetical protein
MDEFPWVIRPEKVSALAESARTETAFLFGTVENELDVWELFDHVACLVIDDRTLRHRLATRTTNEFGKHPAELERILVWNRTVESDYRRFGATIIDATRPLENVTSEVLALGRP